MAVSQSTKPRSLVVGERFTRLVVLGRDRTRRLGSYWWCRCDCGTIKSCWSSHLRRQRIQSCGCLNREITRARTKIQSGQRYGRLTIIERDSARTIPSVRSYWRCRCDCGAIVSVYCSHLTTGKIVSCGCYARERTSARATTHGATRGGYTPEYRAWMAIKYRCFKPSAAGYCDYGGRGITMAALYINDFPAFLAEIGPRPSPRYSIDRIDNEKGYEPGNMRWATSKQQRANQRKRQPP